MSFFGDLRHTPAATKPPGCTSGPEAQDPRVSLMNLSSVQARMDSLQKFLSDSVNSRTLIGKDQMDMVSSEISAAIQQVIVNGAALLAYTQSEEIKIKPRQSSLNLPSVKPGQNINESNLVDPKSEFLDDDDWEIRELDAVELLAEHIHFCEICGKGFKRDANLRMHMRAHGNQFKTPEALAKPDKSSDSGCDVGRKARFSCPFVGCSRNKSHKKFRPLKSVICVKNHFKRSHCPKMYSCNRCNKKSFSVVADLKSHLKHCGETKWKCSCGTSFSRKDKLFGHMALFEGHMPAVEVEVGEGKGAVAMVEDEEEDDFGIKDVEIGGNGISNNGFFEGVFDGLGSIDSYCFQEGLGVGGSPTGMDAFFNF